MFQGVRVRVRVRVCVCVCLSVKVQSLKSSCATKLTEQKEYRADFEKFQERLKSETLKSFS